LVLRVASREPPSRVSFVAHLREYKLTEPSRFWQCCSMNVLCYTLYWCLDMFTKLHTCIVYIGYCTCSHVPVFALVAYFCAMSASSLASRAAAASGSLVGQHTPTLSRRLETSSRPRTPVLLATTGGHQRLVLWLAIADALELCSQLGLALRLPVRLFGGTLSLLVLLLLTP
jgi:hypothetical protein